MTHDVVEKPRSMLSVLDALTRETQIPEAEVIAWVFQAGLRQLWRERTLGRYLHGEISRDETIQAVGIDWVELAEQQHAAMMEDLAWALQS